MYTDSYKLLQEQYHIACPEYGCSSSKWATSIIDLAKQFGIKTILDYGCGKGLLRTLGDSYDVTLFDPFVEEFKQRPKDNYQLVICTDVMEHTEPQFTNEIISDIFYYSNYLVFFNIAVTPAVKTLPDGRNTHINLKSINEWTKILLKYFNLINVSKQFNEKGTYEALNFLGIKFGIDLRKNV